MFIDLNSSFSRHRKNVFFHPIAPCIPIAASLLPIIVKMLFFSIKHLVVPVSPYVHIKA